jgi:hypothetical protein
LSKIASLVTLLATALVCLLPAAPAQALAARTFVSAAGSDSNNCINVATPCRHLAAAYAATSANGEIYVLDPANYGSLTITGPVSIEGHGWASIAPVAGQAAITINGNPGDAINIIGVVLDGTSLSGTGIQFNAGGSLTIRDSVIRNFTTGIIFAPNASAPSQLFMSNTLVSDNASFGIILEPNGTGAVAGVLSRVDMVNNDTGLAVISSGPATNVTVSDSVASSNVEDCIDAADEGGTVNVMVRNSTLANNGLRGLESDGPGATVLVTRSTITGNAAGWFVFDSGALSSYNDNNIDGNGSANTAPPAIGYK